MSKVTEATIIATAGIAVLLCSSCGWESKLVWSSPDGKAKVEIQQKLPVNLWGLRLILTSGGQTTLLKEQRGDSLVTFADVYWEKDSSAVAAYACGIQNIKVAYNLKESQPVPFERFEAKIAANIRAQYALGADKSDRDIFVWSCSEGADAFRRKYTKE